jgi:hypothetical protein
MSLEQARINIIETTLHGFKVAWSILEKENESGLMFNDRVFFIEPMVQFGYLSDAKSLPSADSLTKAKTKVPINNIRNVLVNERQINLKFVVEDGTRLLEKSWILRAATEGLAKSWQDRLRAEKSREVLRHTEPRLIEQEQAYQSQLKERSQSRHKQSHSKPKKLSFSRTVELSASFKSPPRESKEFGVTAQTEPQG